MPENHGCPNLFLPNHWNRVISPARLACVHTWAWAAGSLDTCIGQKVVADNARWNPSPALQAPNGVCGTHSPIEEMWSKINQVLRSLAARTFEGLIEAIGIAIKKVSLQGLAGWFIHCGYAT